MRFGSNWVSLPHDFVAILLSNENETAYLFKQSKCPDELFIQKIIEKYEFSNRLSKYGNLRYIKWKKSTSSPIVFTDDSIDELLNARNLGFLFARKLKIENKSKFKEIITKK
ncbi:TPA: hypothetical protein U2D95_001838 [Streptococcus suis]|nr:hypothetical protein [Streptococcus suis]